MSGNTLLNKTYRNLLLDRNIYVASSEYYAIVHSQQHNINQLGAEND
jgi:hypothetical protein